MFKANQLSLFPEFEQNRVTSQEAIELTTQSLIAYGRDYDHWAISFSGGKDSSALVTLVVHLIEYGKIPQPKTLSILYVDTRMELPPLQTSAMQILAQCKKRGFEVEVVMAPLEKRFLPYILGRGVPPPNNSTLRWCTQAIKLDPMKAAMRRLYEKYNQKVLSLNGVRIGESAIRDRRILTSCSKNGSECGQGWFQRDLPDSICDKLAPILHWRICQIWDWLRFDAPALGFDTEILVDVYGGDEAEEINARTGCICCPLSEKDLALDSLIEMPQWKYLAPLKELRRWYEWARRFDNRLQKAGERNKNGNYSAGPCRKGPLTITARQQMLDGVLNIQHSINKEATKLGQPQIDLLNAEEVAHIQECHKSNVFPNGWDGNEPLGSELLPQIYQDGTTQLTLW